MNRPVTSEVGQRVAQRSDFLCEYCLIAEEDTFFGCEVEHIISLKHGGSSDLDNLAYACVFCNRLRERMWARSPRPVNSPDSSTLERTVGQITFSWLALQSNR